MSPPGEVSLKDHLETMLVEMDKRYEQRFSGIERNTITALAATKEALTIALAAVEKGNAAAIEANKVLAAKAEEFADQKLQTHNSIRPWVESLINIQSEKITAQVEKLTGLERRVSRFENREEGIGWTAKLVIGAIGLVATLIGIYFAFR